MIVDRIRNVKKEVLKVMSEMKVVCDNLYGYTLLQTIPGFGPYITALVLATIGNPFRFKSRKQVIRLAGLDLNAKRSGKTSSVSIPVISKKGDADMRYGLYQAGLIASNCNESFRQLFYNMLEGRQRERGIRTKMRVKLAARLLVIAWTMLKSNEPFDASRLTTDLN
ncbi:MAG: hypothetical protein COW04_13075 [Deltaproteobacteria bacterium CG12_big_fil_rev_8_21_14_0_65_43_10]|nr:MAG: hypothetical protein COW04_13075 [Deltaproteobacteria bacterium CG12_big_fil_rev_8_21_14_0_65_43_10]